MDRNFQRKPHPYAMHLLSNRGDRIRTVELGGKIQSACATYEHSEILPALVASLGAIMLELPMDTRDDQYLVISDYVATALAAIAKLTRDT